MDKEHIVKLFNEYIRSTSYHHTFRFCSMSAEVLEPDYDWPVFYMIFDERKEYRGCGVWEHGGEGYTKCPYSYVMVNPGWNSLHMRKAKQAWKRYLNSIIAQLPT